MTQEQFFDYCFRANASGEMRNGSGATVRLLFPDGDVASPYYIEFYPDFVDGTIAALRGNVRHEAWAPWNEQYFAGEIMRPVSRIIAREAGGAGAFELDEDADLPTMIKRDGGREIVLLARDERAIELSITDLAKQSALRKHSKAYPSAALPTSQQ